MIALTAEEYLTLIEFLGKHIEGLLNYVEKTKDQEAFNYLLNLMSLHEKFCEGIKEEFDEN